MATLSTRTHDAPIARKKKSKMNAPAIILLAPAVLLLLSVTLYPFLYLLYTSFFSQNLMNPSAKAWIGFGNYAALFKDADVIRGFTNTLVFAFGAVGIQMILGTLIALILDKDLPGMKAITIMMLIPMSITPIVGALTWKYLLTPPFGWVGYYLQKLGIIDQPIVFLGSGFSAMMSMIALDVWNWTPFVALILLAGLKSRPHDQLEAASIDGARRYQVFIYITLPFLKRFILIAVVLRLIEAFKNFTGVFGLTNGGPGNSTLLASLVVYRKALESFQIGYAAAIAFIFLILLSIITTPLIGRLQKEITND
ncbi:carbohydrate ABC transporter permease [Paenibacillus abyssi]|uniref:Sugar ABC transporter permease n=1 Tax=Paenibacillus abyssi TaxID=1340531 RepID=A0A917CXT0_9BACL|nr:sugar ABC transporter permease [Paenibacillus abyssi]GGG01262.1 sugar ABC transporter permease [Paenibacillus abyssi]